MNEEKKITNLKEFIEQMESDIEEYGALHNQHCPCNMEDPDECDCEEMKAIKSFTKGWMEKVNIFWCEMAEAHRPHCKPEGNKMLTRMMGKKNRTSFKS